MNKTIIFSFIIGVLVTILGYQMWVNYHFVNAYNPDHATLTADHATLTQVVNAYNADHATLTQVVDFLNQHIKNSQPTNSTP